MLLALLVYFGQPHVDLSVPVSRPYERGGALSCAGIRKGPDLGVEKISCISPGGSMPLLACSCPPCKRVYFCCRRFVLQPGALPPSARLSAQLGALRAQAAELDAAGCTSAERDFADVLLRADGSTFRCCAPV